MPVKHAQRRSFGTVLWLAALAACAQQAAPAQAPSPPAASGSTAPAPGGPAHPATQDQVREYLTLTGVSAAVHAVMTGNVESMQTSALPYYPADFWADMKAGMSGIDPVAVYTPVLQHYLSEEDMSVVLAFYRSPAGKAFLATQPAIAREAQMALRKRAGEVGEAVYAKHKDEIETAKKKYDAAHPGAGK